MTKLNNETRELNIDELESVSGGFGFFDNLVWDLIKTESASGFVANAVRQTGNTPGK
jgi:bacteriocin-like protein